MKQYKVGDEITLKVRITEVHPQGYKLGLAVKGGPKMPTEQEAKDMTDEEYESHKVELPAKVIGEILETVEIDTAGRVHFDADQDI